MRDILTHRYFHVDWNVVWASIQEELPVLKIQMERLFQEHVDIKE